MVLKFLQCQTEVFFMLIFILRVDQYVIYEHHDKLVQIIHIVGQVFNQSKIHHHILVLTIPQNEGRLKMSHSYIFN
jgi:hypothetical protein